MQELCFIGVPRTGTSHIVEIISSCKSIKSRAEIFHPNGSFVLSRDEVTFLEKVAGEQFSDPLDPNLVRYVRKNPTVLLDVLCRVDTGQRLNSFKIFPNHLTIDQIHRELVLRKDMHFVFVQRLPIDSHISDLKALRVGAHREVDTTNIHVELSISRFLQQFKNLQDWYKITSAMILSEGKRYSVIYYESDVRCSAEECLLKIQSAAEAAGIDSGVFHRRSPTLGGLKIQDASIGYHDKVSNWEKFVDELKENNLYDAAFSYYALETTKL